MKERLTRLISRLEDETLLVSALQLNDDAQAALDRHADMVAVAEGRRPGSSRWRSSRPWRSSSRPRPQRQRPPSRRRPSWTS